MVGKKDGLAATTNSKSCAVSTQTNLFHYYKRQLKVTNKPSTIEVPNDLNESVVELQSVIPSEQNTTIASTSLSRGEEQSSRLSNSATANNVAKSPQLPEYFQGLSEVSFQLSAQPSDFDSPMETTCVGGKQTEAVETSTSRQSQRKLYPIFTKGAAIASPSVMIHREKTSVSVNHDSFPNVLERVEWGIREASAMKSSEIIDLTTPTRQKAAPLDLTTPADNCGITSIDQGSQEKPINLTESPLHTDCSTKPLNSDLSQHSPTTKQGLGVSGSLLPKSRSKAVAAPWPTSDCQHIKGPQTSFSSPYPPSFQNCETSYITLTRQGQFPKRPDQSNSLLQGGWHTSDRINRDIIMASLPSTHLGHPGIARFVKVTPNHASDNSELWTRKWRPRRAEEVLGNEAHALFLRAWLQALAVQGPSKPSQTKELAKAVANRGIKRPKIIRSVAKESSRKKRRIDSDDDDWIALEGISEDDEGNSGGTVFQSGASLDRRLGYTASADRPPRYENLSKSHKEVPQNVSDSETESKPSNFATLTNTILLEGPSGSGKTCTIYACAEELGWEVFEVYPGIGKRSGGSISSLIGDVGKNHIVRRHDTLHTRDGNYDKHNTDHFGRHGEKNKANEHHENSATVQQSIILLEEVDILYKEDVNFWSAVVNLIKTSHRPVIMTCNDATLVPQCDLPLQTCLHFEACPLPLAVSFLQLACLAESHLVARTELEIIYAKTYNLICSDERDELPFPSQARPCPDLRRTINELQFYSCVADSGADVDVAYDATATDSWDGRLVDWIAGPSAVENASAAATHDIYWIWKHCEYSSFLDAHLERHPSDALEALAIDRYGPSADDEVGHTLLDKSPSRTAGLAFYNRDTQISGEALTLSHHVVGASAVGTRVRDSLHGDTRHMNHRTLIQERMANQVRAVSFLDDVISLTSPLYPRAAAILDYTPYVRQMILADDAMEAEAQEMRGSEMRRGRRSQWRAESYPRYLNVSVVGQAEARNLAFSE